MAQNSEMNLFKLKKLVQSLNSSEEQFECDAELVTKVKTYFQKHKEFLEMSPEKILRRRVKGGAGEE